MVPVTLSAATHRLFLIENKPKQIARPAPFDSARGRCAKPNRQDDIVGAFIIAC